MAEPASAPLPSPRPDPAAAALSPSGLLHMRPRFVRPQGIFAPIHALPAFFRRVGRRFGADGCLPAAGALAFTSLLALVPLLAIGLALIAGFPGFAPLREQMLQYVLETFVPAHDDGVRRVFQGFVANAGGMTGFGVVGLAVSAVMLLQTIQKALNKIWRAPARPIWVMVPIYWLALTMGPLLFGAALSTSSVLAAQARGVFGETGAQTIGLAAQSAPIALQFVGYLILYKLMPNARVRVLHAVLGAFAAALLLETTKRLFGFYIAHMPGYTAIYGALAAVPVFFLWIYLAWIVTLLGAEIVATLGEGYRVMQVQDETAVAGPLGRAETLAAALAMLRAADDQRADGAAGDPDAMPYAESAVVVDRLVEGRLLARLDDGRLVLRRDLAAVRLADLCVALEIAPAAETGPAPEGVAGDAASGAVAAADRAVQDALATPVAAVVAGLAPTGSTELRAALAPVA